MSTREVHKHYDVMVIGAGAAGLSAVLGLLRSEAYQQSAELGYAPSVLVISKLHPLRSHTGSAEGGIAASLANVEPDDWHWHWFDTVKGGDWLVDQDAAQILAQDAPQTVIQLEHDGVAFSRTADGHIDQRRFGGHTAEFGGKSVRRTAYAADRIGHQILHSLWQQCVRLGVQFAEEWYVSDLVLDNHQAQGVIAIDMSTGNTHAIGATHIVLATGGAGRVFHTTTNSWDLTGDGMALSLAAGLQLEDIEFVQFHPTGLAHTGLLLSEAARAEGGTLRNAQGEQFMQRYAPEHGDLAARDVVSRAIMAEIDAGRGVADPTYADNVHDCVWLDLRAIDADILRSKLPEVVSTIETYTGLNPEHDLIPIRPTAHYTMGGIPITLNGEVYKVCDGMRQIIRGLYAAGECSCVSVHGANRLGANSLLDACLFGTRAGQTIAQQLLSQMQEHSAGSAATVDSLDADLLDSDSVDTTTSAELDDANPVQETATALQTALNQRKQFMETLLHKAQEYQDANQFEDGQQTIVQYESQEKSTDNATDEPSFDAQSGNVYALMRRIGIVMEQAAAVRCNAESLEQGLAALDVLSIELQQCYPHTPVAAYNQEIVALMEVQHMLVLAQAMLQASLSRQESRGSLSRTDYPHRDDEHWLRHSMIDQHMQLQYQQVHITQFPPTEREY